MDKETYRKQKAFAGEKKPSMRRRCVGHDYTRRGVYMLTMVTEGRRPLFANIHGNIDAPCVELTKLGRCVSNEWWGIPRYYPKVEILGLQMMPDHLHGIIYVKERMECDLSRIVRGFKTGCGRAYRELFPQSVATQSQQTPSTQSGSHPSHGLLFEPGFNDRILKEEGQLERWRNYLRDNPKRLLMKREHPDLFRIQHQVVVNGVSFSILGNRFLLSRPERIQVQCSRRLTEQEVDNLKSHYLERARQGAVLVSPCISKGEKAIMRAAFEEGLPLIVLLENGFTELSKPSGKRMEACSQGQLLLMAPWEHHNEQRTITRLQCLQLNDMAELICQ